jgi:hypothetical protein
MLARIDLIYRLKYATVGADHVSDALGILSGRIIRSLVCYSYLSFCIAKQAEGEIELFGESSVLFYSIKTDAEYLGILVCVLLDSITEPNTFSRSARRVCLRIKPQDDRAAFEVAQSNIFARVGLHIEIGCLVSYVQHNLFSFLTGDCTHSAPLMLHYERAKKIRLSG